MVASGLRSISRRQGPVARHTSLISVCLLLLLAAPSPSLAQAGPDFNVSLQFDYTAAEQAIALYTDEFVNTLSLASLRGSRIVSSTTGLIAERRDRSGFLQSYLDSLKRRQQIQDDVFQLEEARSHAAGIKELLNEMKRRNFNRRIVATVGQIFPATSRLDISIPVHVVAFGHENVDAFVRRVAWNDGVPRFVGEDEGELTIVINLAHAAAYGRDVDERLLSILGVVAHEVFHAAFETYKEGSPRWSRFHRRHTRPFDDLLALVQNEGIAYYLSLEHERRGNLPHEWNTRMRESFKLFGESALEILSPSTSPARISQLMHAANLSGYWESYGSMVGMFIARQIDLSIGRTALIETLELGPIDFFRKYLSLIENERDLPQLPPAITIEIASFR